MIDGIISHCTFCTHTHTHTYIHTHTKYTHTFAFSYFYFLGHYTTCLLPIGLMGLVVMLDVFGESSLNEDGNYSLAYGLGSAKLLPLYGLLVALWAVLMLGNLTPTFFN